MKRILIIIIFMIFAFSFGYVFYNGHINFGGSKLIIPMTKDINSEHKLYSIYGTTDNSDEVFLYSDEYTRIKYPNIKEDELIFVAQKKKNNNFFVLLYENNRLSELIESNTEIFSPVLVDNDNLIFMQNDSENFVIKKYDFLNDEETIITKDALDTKSYIQISNSNELLYVLKEDSEYSIMLSSGSESEKLTTGRYPCFIEDNLILFYEDRSLKILNNETKEVKVVLKDVTVMETPAINLEQNLVAFYEIDDIHLFGGEVGEFLSVVTMDSWKKFRIESYDSSKKHYSNSGLTWMIE